MTVHKTKLLKDGSTLEFHANVGAEPKYLENGVPVTKDYYYDRLYLEENPLKVSFLKKFLNLFKLPVNNCNQDCNQGRNCKCTDMS